MKKILASILLAISTPVTAQARPDAPPTNEVLHWNRAVTDAFAAAQLDPLTESRMLAIVQLAVHDALAHVPCVEQGEFGFSTDAAVAAAAHDAAIGLLPAAAKSLDAELARSLQAVADGKAGKQGAAIGRASAAHWLAARAHDGADRKVEVPAGTKPGEYRPTPPDLTPAWMAQWGSLTPFALRTPGQFRPSAPPAVDSAVAQRDIEQVRRVGGQTGSTRTDEQTAIAQFWYENSTQGWNRIARVAAQAQQLDAPQSARLFALLNAAMADGYIAMMEAKYHYLYWRPVTAIRAAGAQDWLSFLPTPPIPDYPSGHAVIGAAAATVLARFFASDFVAFETTSGQPFAGLTRRFVSFSAAAQENAASRVLAGIHFPTAVRVGLQVGDDVGNWAFDNALPPQGAHGAASEEMARR
jgi:hypothetical protein